MKLLKRSTAFFLTLVILTGLFAMFPRQQVKAAFVNDLEMHCDAYYMVNLETGIVVTEKNADKQKYPASLTKIMTCLIVIEYYTDLAGERMTITYDIMNNKTLLNEQVWSPTGLKVGERIRLIDLLYCAMLASDNYAALALATKVAQDKGNGDLSWFIQRMNAKAKEIGCTGTQFVNPHGLFNANHYSTAHDFYLITKYALELPEFANIVSTDVPYSRPITNMTPEPFKFETTNHLMLSAYGNEFYQYTKGVKTGFLKNAGHCLSTYATKDGYSYILILLDDGAPTNYTSTNWCFADAKALFQWAFGDLSLKTVLPENQPVTTIDLKYAWGADKIDLIPTENYTTLLPSHITNDSIEILIDAPESLIAPVYEDQIVGTATLYYANAEIGKVDLCAARTVQRSEFLYMFSGISRIFESNYFYALLGSMFLAVGLYIVIAFVRTQRLDNLKRASKTVTAREQVLWRDGDWRDPADKSYNVTGNRTTPGARAAEERRQSQRSRLIEEKAMETRQERMERLDSKKSAIKDFFSTIVSAAAGVLYMIGETVVGLFEGLKNRAANQPQKRRYAPKQPRRTGQEGRNDPGSAPGNAPGGMPAGRFYSQK